MSQNESQAAGSRSLSSAVGEMARWKKALLTTAIFLVVAGVGFRVAAWAGAGGRGGSEAPAGEPTASSVGASGISRSLAPQGAESSFLPGGEATRVPRTGSGEAPAAGTSSSGNTFEAWSPVLVRGGLSFLVGFCVGYAVRTFLRLSAVFAGLLFLILFGLSYAGVLEVHWDVLQVWFDRSVESLKTATADFQAFMSGSLPVAGAATAGIFTGMKKS